MKRSPQNVARIEEENSPWLERFYNSLAFLVTASLAATLVYMAWDSAQLAAENETRIRFGYRTKEMRQAIQERVSHYVHALSGARALFAASASVSREAWRAYIQNVQFDVTYPGVQSIGFAPWVSAAERAQYVSAVRAEGFPDYVIQPAGVRADYAPVLFVEPFEGSNLRTFGYDMFWEPVQQSALKRARDTGTSVLSSKPVLRKEKEARTAFFMYLPIYHGGRDPGTVVERRRALTGFVYAAVRVDDLMRHLFGRMDDIRIRIYDGVTARAEALLYDTLSRPEEAHAASFELTTQLPLLGHTWTLRFSSRPVFEQTIDHSKPRLIAAAGGLVILLLLALIWVLTTARTRAIALVQRTTADLRDSRERLALALEGSAEALFDWNVATAKVQLSERWNEILGGSQESTVTAINELEELVHPDDLPALRKHLRDVLKGSVPFYQVEHRVRTHDGSWKWILSRAKVVERDAAGRALRLIGTNGDITERKKDEQRKSEFIATVSHELRTPLTAISGALSLLKETIRELPDPDSSRFLDMALANSDRLAALINDILDVEKLDAGLMRMRRERIALGPFLKHVLELNQPYAQRFGVEFRLTQPLPEVQVIGDEERIIQVMANLLSNAAKFSPRGEVVSIAVALRSNRVRVEVTDRGPGISLEFRSRIFRRFAQDDSSDSRSKGGTGLGLWISRALVEKLGGTIGFESEIGRGTTFHFELPLG